MSRIGKLPINIPFGVNVKIEDKIVIVTGPKGELKQEIIAGLGVEIKDKQIIINKIKINDLTQSCFGLLRTLISNMVQGVTTGYSKTLELVGTGFRASIESANLKMLIGFSHPVIVKPPQGIEFKVENNNLIKITGIDKKLVGQVAANIRDIKKPEPYKGKGIRYQGEHIRKKAGKAAAKTTTASTG